MMKLDVFAPDEKVGDVIGDLNRRRGMIQGQEPLQAASASRPRLR